MPNPVNTQVWLNTNTGTDGTGPGTDADRVLDVEKAINLGINVYEESGGLTFKGAGQIKGGKTDYDVGIGFWLGADPDDFTHKVAIGNPSANTFNFDGQFIDSQMRNLELTGWLRGPSTFTIDPATHGDNTGTVVIAGNLQVDGTTTTVNSTVVEIDDVAIQLAAEATTATLANNGGIIVGTFTNNPFILYRNSYDAWEVNKDWTPNTNNAHALGNTTNRWENVYAHDGNFSDDLTVGDDLNVGGDISATGSLSGSSLNIGGGDFTVDSSGNTASNGTITATSVGSPGGGLNVPGGSNDQILKHDGTKLVYTDHVLSEINNVSTTAPVNKEVLKYNTTTQRWEPDHVDYSEIDNPPTIPTNITQIDPGSLLDNLIGDLDGFTDPNTGVVGIRLLNDNSTVKGSVNILGGTNISVSESSDVLTIDNTAPTPVQSNWNETNTSSLAFIQNKPALADDLNAIAVVGNTQQIAINLVDSNSSTMGTVTLEEGTNISLAESNDIITISSTVPTPVQSNWNETNTSSLAFIQNKPTIYSTFSSLTDTNFTSLADKDIARYNSSSQEWENFSETPVQFTTSFTPSGCSHYKVFVTQKGDLVHLQARFHVNQESNSSNTWNSVLVAPAGYSVPVPPSFVNTPRVVTGTGITIDNSGGNNGTVVGLWVATYDDAGTINVIKHGSTSYASVTDVKANSATYLLINITFTI